MGISLAWGQELIVRHDALAFRAAYHAPLDTVTMARFWQNTAVHSEAMYNGDGSWGLGYADWPTHPYPADHPLVRVVARHVLGLLTLIEAGLADPSMEQRVELGLNWLLERQTEEGAWPVYTTNRGVVSGLSALPTALASMVLSRGYRLLGNPRYLEAATKALEWQTLRPQEGGPLAHGLVLASVLEHYETVHEQELIEWAAQEGRILLDSQLPNGSWNDPGPLQTDEHAVVTGALIRLELALVDEHPDKRRLRGGVNAAVNFLLEKQLDDGNFAAGPAELSAQKVPTFEVVALILARKARQVGGFDMAIRGAVRALNTHPSNRSPMLPGEPGGGAAAQVPWRGTQSGRFLAMTVALVWFTQTQTPPQPEEEGVVAPSGNVRSHGILPGGP